LPLSLIPARPQGECPFEPVSGRIELPGHQKNDPDVALNIGVLLPDHVKASGLNKGSINPAASRQGHR
jgi:hypothetical protein